MERSLVTLPAPGNSSLPTITPATVDRRSFLAAAAMVATVPGLPAAAGGYPIPAPSNEFVASYGSQGEVTSIHSTLGEARQFSAPSCDVDVMAFIPLDDAARFCVVELDWQPPAPHFLGLGKLSKAAEKRLTDQWQELRQKRPTQASLVDVLPGMAGMSEDWQVSPLVTRERGLLGVAEINRDLWHRAGDYVPDEWAVLIEVGRSPVKPLRSVIMYANGIGTLNPVQALPVRLVRPTADELAAYPLDWKGGAA